MFLVCRSLKISTKQLFGMSGVIHGVIKDYNSGSRKYYLIRNDALTLDTIEEDM